MIGLITRRFAAEVSLALGRFCFLSPLAFPPRYSSSRATSAKFWASLVPTWWCCRAPFISPGSPVPLFSRKNLYIPGHLFWIPWSLGDK
ncbi:hypothetical protein P170DRAFT_23222 [Aspergillus steynii IBT 23096]|uniref:Uncharacterized protein n=1 Tax=Aspergillus steynii IBT 23096 TaxID=1392250 RepID=A0A2I2GP51_9EURO|nr:uncharacterized protein P170DRAFT_23222 [Aspergillus steynii IBT 23096]PLB54654.1 hypothetical protein P170DRAFT_23222 [Aspergillus steynii IBT 23096]